ncbi:HAD hydrolase family protein [Lentibacillus sp. Marseille-P4043]|uniref:HAD hydrolase family protein n=1 Tax=Lentibacillus sp. Marseille-P4043 TaxID=2040293 RepID=UPI003FA35508
MARDYKLIAIDIDGTLHSHHQITPRTKAALMKAQETGAVIVLASGRSRSGFVNQIRSYQRLSI